MPTPSKLSRMARPTRIGNEGETSVVFSQTGIVMGMKIRAIRDASIEVRMPEINVLIRHSCTPMLGEGVLQPATNHPADIRLRLFADNARRWIREIVHALGK